MGNPHTTAWQEIGQFLNKILIYVFYIGMGVIAKITFDSRGHKLTWKQIFVKTVLSIIVGSLASIWCINSGNVKLGTILVPTATVAGEGVIGYVVINFNKWMDSAMKVIFPKK